MTNLAQKKPTDDPADVIVSQSLLTPLTITTVVLVFSLAWMFFDEYYSKQPWRHIYQPRYLNVAHDYWVVKEQEASARAELGQLLVQKLDLLERKYAGPTAVAQNEASEIIQEFKDEYPNLENTEAYLDWEKRLVAKLAAVNPPAPGKIGNDEEAPGLATVEEDFAAVVEELKTVDADIMTALTERYLKPEEAKGSNADKLALIKPRLMRVELLALEAAGFGGNDGAYERDLKKFMSCIAPIKGIEYRISIREKDYVDIDGLVTDATGLKNERARYLADLYLFDSGRDKGIIEDKAFLDREERVWRRAPAQLKLRAEINALANERIDQETPRIEQRKLVTKLTADLEAIRARIVGVASTSVDIIQRYIKNEGANNIVDRCESCHTGTDKAGMDQAELWRVSGAFVAADFIDKNATHDFFHELTEEEMKRVRFELESPKFGKSFPEAEAAFDEFQPSEEALPTLKDLADVAGAYVYKFDETVDEAGLTAFERRYGKGKKLDARVKTGYGLMALARAEGFLRGEMGELGQVPGDPAALLNDRKFIELVTARRFRVLFRYASRDFRTYVRDHLLMFASHPDTHGLLDVHKPSEFGCTTCHEGNGRHILDKDMGHGYYHHSLWQLFKDGYYEAGCQMCHNKQIETDGAPQLQAARDQFMRNGCYGCHKYEGFEPQADERMQVGKDLVDLKARENSVLASLDKLQRRLKEVEAAYGANTDDKNLEDQYQRVIPGQIQARSYELYELQRQILTAEKRTLELNTEIKHVGPNLEQLAAKLEDPTWLARWVRYPKGFRPSTKMPHFFYGPFSYEKDDEGNAVLDDHGNQVLNTENVEALKLIVAYVWQASKWSKDRGLIKTPGGGNSYGVPVGDAASVSRGKDLFETRGCMGCHTDKPDIEVKGGNIMPVGKYLTPAGKPTMSVDDAARDKQGLLVKNEDVHSWAANLSRVGEKNNPDYLVEWILQPRSKDKHSVMPSIWSQAADFNLSADSVRALGDRIKAAFAKGGLADYVKTDFYARPEVSFAPAGLNLSGPEVAELRKDLTIWKSIEEAKLVVAYLKSLASPQKSVLDAPQDEIFKRTGTNKPYGFMESDGTITDSIVRDIEILPVGQKDGDSENSENKQYQLKGYAEFQKWMNAMYDGRQALAEARSNMAATLGKGGDVSRFADQIVAATQKMRDARERLEGTFAGFGRKYVAYYGCASCHNIPGMEEEGKIGTELTYEGSKLIERLDFGLMHEHPDPDDKKAASQDAFAPLVTRSRNKTLGGAGFELPGLFRRDFIRHKHDYDTKLVWFTGKVYSPRQYDKGKRRSNWFERLRMPLFELDEEDTRLIGMFIAGSRETKLPREKFIYQLKGQAKIDADGWWLLRRYNCVGCHDIGRHTGHIKTTPRFAGGVNNQLNTPPKLNDAGLRLNPSWAVAWLQHPNMIRHMQVDGDQTGLDLGLRMPNFGLTESEARAIVAFLSNYAKAPLAYSPPPSITQSSENQEFARAMIASQACNQCHEYREDIDGYRVPGPKAPNLGNAQERARFQWVHGWLLNPDLIQPGPKRMFQFFRTDGRGGSIFNDDPAFGGNADYGKIIKLDASGRWPQDKIPADPAAILRDYVLFYYPKARDDQQALQDLTKRIQDAKAGIK